MDRNSEERARALCAMDAQMAAVPPAEIPALVERLWPIAALEISGGLMQPDVTQVPDLTQRVAEYERLRR
ncbi:hypothetical protein EV667_2444 [Ancylobacter aquaticus]|uniref:Uncharacterized protein n=1 Tax=Ancylobacter aquaticus TaxID=100 RepID=A0A4R1I4V7_ANCAQ|nr:hypothetical protein [Ancylobacter aquaticus]TCK28440.1 hypothetical protein EV667_2444 [Ancylobacter aquaticus]